MADLLFECFSEEIPARMQMGAVEQLATKLGDALKAARLDYASIEPFVSPRHLCVRVKGLPTQQPDQTVERKGPKTSAPDAALQGFLKSTGLSKDQLEIRMVGKDECYFAIANEKGRDTAAALKEILEAILQQFHWPKSQRWGAHAINWVRPLQNICCLFDSKVVPVTFGHLTANNITYGHRFLGAQAITLSDVATYEAQLESAHVIVSHVKRKDKIRAEMLQLAAQHNLTLVEDEGLLNEVAGLVEWPVLLVGEFDSSFLDLPPEVLVSEMRHHQKYFALKHADGNLSNRFVIVSNMITDDGGKAVIHGNGRVLRARLSDGAFFWNQDRKRPLADWATSLDGMVFHAALGSVKEKADRITALCPLLAVFVPHANLIKVARAAQLCKADLVCGMVGEFPDLQGIMGRYYALQQNEDAEVADAIRDHYKPIGAHDDTPRQPLGITVSLADKLDSLVGLFAIDERPTGSKDPYALRRAALGIIRTILDNQLRLPLHIAIEQSAAQYATSIFKTSRDETVEALLQFFADRLKVMLRDQGIRHDYVAAVMRDGDDDLMRVTSKARALAEFLATDDGANLLAAYRRASNIVAAEEKKDAAAYASDPDESLFAEKEESALFAALKTIATPLKDALAQERYNDAMKQLATLRQATDAYLEQVMVNVEDSKLRKNRLYTLSLIRRRMDEIVDFSLIES